MFAQALYVRALQFADKSFSKKIKFTINIKYLIDKTNLLADPRELAWHCKDYRYHNTSTGCFAKSTMSSMHKQKDKKINENKVSGDEIRRNSFSSKWSFHSSYSGGREHCVLDKVLLKTYQRDNDTSQTKSTCQSPTKSSILGGKKLAQNQDSVLKHLETLRYLSLSTGNLGIIL